MSQAIINEREKQHGSWDNNARLFQHFDRLINSEVIRRKNDGQVALTASQEEALRMVLNKTARILSGDATFADHWDDIAGYAMLGKGTHAE